MSKNNTEAPNWVVLTGGPSAGKSATANCLNEMGYETYPEIARVIIDEGLASGLTIDQIRGETNSPDKRQKEYEFQLEAVRRKILLEESLDPDKLVFLDRGMHDSLAYLKVWQFEPEQMIFDACRRSRYKHVFLLEPLPIFEEQVERTETDDEAAQIHSWLFSAYDDYGLTPVYVPFMPVDERVKFILERIDV